MTVAADPKYAQGPTWAEALADPSKLGIQHQPGHGKKSKDFSEELHPRDDHGRFTDTGSLGDTAITQGGFSLSLAGDRPTSGWMVSKLGSERSNASRSSFGSSSGSSGGVSGVWVRICTALDSETKERELPRAVPEVVLYRDPPTDSETKGADK